MIIKITVFSSHGKCETSCGVKSKTRREKIQFAFIKASNNNVHSKNELIKREIYHVVYFLVD